MRRTKATHVPLERLMSKLGVGTRTQAAALILAGRVTVDGMAVTNPIEWWPRGATISIDGHVVTPYSSEHRVLMMHKKRGILTARVDARHEVVCDHPLLADTGCMPVGRLDRASEGLLLFTNDTLLGNALVSPGHLDKTCLVRVNRPLDGGELARLGSTESVNLGGELTQPSRWTSMADERNIHWVRVVLREGRTRQIRRMLWTLSVGVQRLIRVGIGPLQLGDLKRGGVRQLDVDEVDRLRRAAGVGQST